MRLVTDESPLSQSVLSKWQCIVAGPLLQGGPVMGHSAIPYAERWPSFWWLLWKKSVLILPLSPLLSLSPTVISLVIENICMHLTIITTNHCNFSFDPSLMAVCSPSPDEAVLCSSVLRVHFWSSVEVLWASGQSSAGSKLNRLGREPFASLYLYWQ